MLRDLVAGAGLRLDIGLHDAASARSLPTTSVGSLLTKKRGELLAAAEELGAKNVRVFGSVARGADGPRSDVDVLVDLEPGVSLVGLGKLQDAFSRILGREVDIVPASGLKAGLRDQVLAEAIPLE